MRPTSKGTLSHVSTLVSGWVSAFGQPHGPCPQADTQPDTRVDTRPRIPFSFGLIYLAEPCWFNIYYPPDVSSMKYCCLGVFRRQYSGHNTLLGHYTDTDPIGLGQYDSLEEYCGLHTSSSVFLILVSAWSDINLVANGNMISRNLL